MQCDKCKKDKNNLQLIKISYDELMPTPIGVFGERYNKVYRLCNNCARRTCEYIEKNT